jgi:hypothetical protein
MPIYESKNTLRKLYILEYSRFSLPSCERKVKTTLPTGNRCSDAVQKQTDDRCLMVSVFSQNLQ